jgi:PadR family transcriptional regulator, regulatory protein PadR
MNDFVQMQHGSLYPALHRLERREWATFKWETSTDRNREFKYYRLKATRGRGIAMETDGRSSIARHVALG